MREIIIDTETTFLNPREGHRIIELAAVELHGTQTGAMDLSIAERRLAKRHCPAAMHSFEQCKAEVGEMQREWYRC
jgi:DNA polymerase III epsilon subunit-like protein